MKYDKIVQLFLVVMVYLCNKLIEWKFIGWIFGYYETAKNENIFFSFQSLLVALFRYIMY